MGKENQMKNRLNNVMRRRPNRWGNLSVKTFEQDIQLLRDTILKQQAQLGEIEEICKDYRDGKLTGFTDGLLTEMILYKLKRTKI